MNLIDNTVWAAMKGFLKVFSWAYGIRANKEEFHGLEEGAVIGAKHSSKLDFLVMLSLLPRKPVTLMNKGNFTNLVGNYLLRIAGAVPVYSPPHYEELRMKREVNGHSDLIREILESGDLILYAPEGRMVPLKVSEEIYPQTLRKASEWGYNTKLVGIHYRNKYHILSFLKWPWQAGIEVKAEGYDARGKSLAQTSRDVKEAFTRLSGIGGLEHELLSPQK
ncbi:1-acyl-sn-glycerol-3-phosphate acyltransferase [Candidatus Woesearchaeota archaeon]|nr:1-acyl-sn-glycerol-3-phosphate acyltransferase [Candidatus Woesearchaeota archaeon]